VKIKLYPTEVAARRAFGFHVARTGGNPVVNPVTRTCVNGDRSIRFEYLESEADIERFKGLNPTSVEIDDACKTDLVVKVLPYLLRKQR
jgi:hypothetical protein